MDAMHQAMQNLDLQDSLRRISDHDLDVLANFGAILTPTAQREVNAEVTRRLRELRS